MKTYKTVYISLQLFVLSLLYSENHFKRKYGMKVRLRYIEVKLLTQNTIEAKSGALVGVSGHSSKT